MSNTIRYIKETREMYKNLEREDKSFCNKVDYYLREYDLLRTEFIEAKWIIISDMYSKLVDVESAWDVYENPKEYCDSIMSNYNREYLGFKGRLLYRTLPMYILMIVFILLLFSPNGFSMLTSPNNPGIKLNLYFVITLGFYMIYHIYISYDQSKKLFNRKYRIGIVTWILILVYLLLILKIIRFEELERIYFFINPIVLVVIMIGVLLYLFYNRKKLLF